MVLTDTKTHGAAAPADRDSGLLRQTAPQIISAGRSEETAWNNYVSGESNASAFHLFSWQHIIRAAYKQAAYYLMAVHPGVSRATLGVLPLVHLKNPLFGNSLISLPYVDASGILANNLEVERALLREAISLARRVGGKQLELRCERESPACEEICTAQSHPAGTGPAQKVRMLLTLPGSFAELSGTFKSKLRSQINRPLREGCTSRIGGVDLLDDFYKVFLINMRDLGSPVHSKELMRHVLEAFPERSQIFVVYHAGKPIAASLAIGFNGVLRNPWASSDRRYANMSPNMLLYSRMLEYACENGYQTFDFGRSTPGEGTYKFKEQWGAKPAPLRWYVISANGSATAAPESPSERFKFAARLWSKLPVPLTRVLGPRIRKHISL